MELLSHSSKYYFNYFIDTPYISGTTNTNVDILKAMGERLLGTTQIDFPDVNSIFPRINKPEYYCMTDYPTSEDFLRDTVIGANLWLKEGASFESLIPVPSDKLTQFIYSQCKFEDKLPVEEFLSELRKEVILPITDNRILLSLSQLDGISINALDIEGISWKY